MTYGCNCRQGRSVIYVSHEAIRLASISTQTRRSSWSASPPLAQPVFLLPHQRSPDKLGVVLAKFAVMLDMSIICPSRNQWSSPPHMAPKAYSEWHPCGDYRSLSLVSLPDCYPSPHLHDFTSSLSGSSIFSKVDLICWYYKIPVTPTTSASMPFRPPSALLSFSKCPVACVTQVKPFSR